MPKDLEEFCVGREKLLLPPRSLVCAVEVSRAPALQKLRVLRGQGLPNPAGCSKGLRGAGSVSVCRDALPRPQRVCAESAGCEND